MSSEARDNAAVPPDGNVTGSNPETSQELRAYEVEQYTPCFWKFITVIVRLWGLATVILLWVFTVLILNDDTTHQQYIPWYLLIITIIITFLESLYIINKCICCQDDGNCCCTLWRALLWLDDWKKGIAYVALSIPLYIEPYLVYGIISGVLLTVLGVFYTFKSCKDADCVKSKRYKETSMKAPLAKKEGSSKAVSDMEKGASYQATDNAGSNPFEE